MNQKPGIEPIWRIARELRSKTTDAERKLWQHLKSRQLQNVKFRRQYPTAGYIADFASPEIRLVIELDGGQHLEQREYDSKRTGRLACNGHRALRFWNDEVCCKPNTYFRKCRE